MLLVEAKLIFANTVHMCFLQNYWQKRLLLVACCSCQKFPHSICEHGDGNAILLICDDGIVVIAMFQQVCYGDR